MKPALVKEVDLRLRELQLPLKTRIRVLLGDLFWQGRWLLVHDETIAGDNAFEKPINMKTVAFVEYKNSV